MTLPNPVRPRLSRFTFVFFGLAVSVFTWGLQYKLSLYYPPHSTFHQIPEAKLLSRNEQSTPTQASLLSSAKFLGDATQSGLVILTLFAWIVLLRPIRARHTEQELVRPWLVSLSARLNAFFFRPPPDFA
jgi:hypothetical protein